VKGKTVPTRIDRTRERLTALEKKITKVFLGSDAEPREWISALVMAIGRAADAADDNAATAAFLELSAAQIRAGEMMEPRP
jgi:hypothetical protein